MNPATRTKQEPLIKRLPGTTPKEWFHAVKQPAAG
ncbi:hypothetical protein APED_28325 [Acanthopleuribacter pedis]